MTLQEQLIRDEGLRLHPYTDTVGKLTIGVGRNLTDRGLTHDEAEYLLKNDIYRCRLEVRQALPWVVDMNSVRQEVLLNMCFNMGIAGLLGFHTTLLCMHQGLYDAAATHMLESKWARQVGARAVRLAEAMRTGIAQ